MRSGRCYLILVASFSALIVYLASVSSIAAQAPSPSPATSTGITDQQLVDVETKLRATIVQEAEKAAGAATKNVIENAAQVQARGDALIKYTSWVSSAFLSILSVILVLFIACAWRELGVVTKTKAEVEATKVQVETTRREVQTTKDEVEATKVIVAAASTEATTALDTLKEAETKFAIAIKRVQETDAAIADSMKTLAEFIEKQPPIEKMRSGIVIRAGIVGEPPELPEAEDIAHSEAADILIVLADKIKAVQKESLVQSFINLGFYWRMIENYPRAIARFMRAIEIEPTSFAAHRGLCVTFYGLAVEEGRVDKKRLLGAADRECEKAIALEPNSASAWFDKGWILDELGAYEEAVKAYKKAQELDPDKKRPNTWFNCACSYSKWGRQREAFEELSQVIALDRNWDDAEKDPELRDLREDPEYGPRVLELIEQHRQRNRN